MQYLRTFGAMEALGFIVLVTIAMILRIWWARAERSGKFDRTRYVYRRGAVGDTRGAWASPHQRSAAEWRQPENELPPLPFRDNIAPPEGGPLEIPYPKK